MSRHRACHVDLASRRRRVFTGGAGVLCQAAVVASDPFLSLLGIEASFLSAPYPPGKALTWTPHCDPRGVCTAEPRIPQSAVSAVPPSACPPAPRPQTRPDTERGRGSAALSARTQAATCATRVRRPLDYPDLLPGRDPRRGASGAESCWCHIDCAPLQSTRDGRWPWEAQRFTDSLA